jgi:glycine/D-amino acid oxidase-like deaminating enzyme/nitrite reductase/ring-hydroxylating ferredoxin subunit
METRQGKATSLWIDTAPEMNFPTQSQAIEVDVVIIGGGISGITAASELKAAGRTVALIEAGRLLQGVTGQTTAKITSQHTLIYSHLIQHFGEARARAYAEANQTAIEYIAQQALAQHIDCDLERREAWTWADSDEEVELLRREAEAAERCGLPARFSESVPLPFPAKAGLCFENQAQFHPHKYLLPLAQAIPGYGSHVFENTCALKVEQGEPCTVITTRGTIRARDVILATHYPFIDHSLYALRLRPHRAYLLAARLKGPAPEGMFINVQRTRSLRAYAADEGEMALIVGEGHMVGEGGDTRVRYRNLEQWAREVLPVEEIAYHWSTHDHQSIDHVPLIGRLSPVSRHVYVATGFGGWGMSNGTVAGLLLRDLVLGRENPWAEVYAPNRVNLSGTRDLVRLTFTIGKHWVGDRLRRQAPEIALGEGKVIAGTHGQIAVYRDEQGEMHAHSGSCTHMGCVLQWNGAETSWDCPCHGSRFSAVDGRVLHGPAIEALERRSLDELEQVRKTG